MSVAAILHFAYLKYDVKRIANNSQLTIGPRMKNLRQLFIQSIDKFSVFNESY